MARLKGDLHLYTVHVRTLMFIFGYVLLVVEPGFESLGMCASAMFLNYFVLYRVVGFVKLLFYFLYKTITLLWFSFQLLDT